MLSPCLSLQWYAIGLNLVGELEGPKEKLKNAFLIRDHFQVRNITNRSESPKLQMIVFIRPATIDTFVFSSTVLFAIQSCFILGKEPRECVQKLFNLESLK